MEAGDIKLNLGPDTINSSLFIYTAILSFKFISTSLRFTT